MNFREVIRSSPALFPLHQSQDGRHIQLVHLTEQEYSAASFLDSRLLQSEKQHAVVEWAELEAASKDLPMECDFLFHISHVGSTLLSRLLGLSSQVFSVREPAILRELIEERYQERLNNYLGLFSRTFHLHQRALIKTTSFVNEIASQLMSQSSRGRALLLYIPPDRFLQALLDGSQSDIDSHAKSRRERLIYGGMLEIEDVDAMSPGERVAMAWLCEMSSLAAVSEEFPNRSQWMDFEMFLESPSQQLREIQRFYQVDSEPNVAAIDALMKCYSKRPDVRYDASFRQDLLAQSQKKFAMEIEKGMAWLARPVGQPLMRRITQAIANTT